MQTRTDALRLHKRLELRGKNWDAGASYWLRDQSRAFKWSKGKVILCIELVIYDKSVIISK